MEKKEVFLILKKDTSEENLVNEIINSKDFDKFLKGNTIKKRNLY